MNLQIGIFNFKNISFEFSGNRLAKNVEFFKTTGLHDVNSKIKVVLMFDQ